jgi:hypothetical protein
MDVRCCPKADKRADVLGRPLCAKSDLTRRSYTSNPPVTSPAKTDLLLRNVNTGGLEVYDINNNQLTNACRATVHTPRGTRPRKRPTNSACVRVEAAALFLASVK